MSTSAQAVTICDSEVPDAYLGHLQIESKYDQTDDTKSTLLDAISLESQTIKDIIYSYMKLIPHHVDQVLEADEKDKERLALCLSRVLDEWAVPKAILSTDASLTGMAIRKWAMATITMGLYKLSIPYPEFKLNSDQSAWLTLLSNQIKLDYSDSLTDPIELINNHDYWSAWAVTVAGMLLGNRTDISWGYVVLDRALGQIVSHDDLSIGWLPNEMQRGDLSLNYIHFSLSPLVMLSVYAETNGHTLEKEQLVNLDKLVRFASLAWLGDPSAMAQFSEAQLDVEQYKLNWLLPYLHINPNEQSARTLYFEVKETMGDYSLLGGDLSVLFNLDFLERTASPPEKVMF